jgi:hypothetical protein
MRIDHKQGRSQARWAALLGMLSAAVTATCGEGPTVLEASQTELASNQARWEAWRPAAYAYVLSRGCECTRETTGPVRVLVLGPAPIAWEYTDSGASVAEEHRRLFPGVEGLFEVLRDAIQSGYRVTVRYDEQSGVPVHMEIDPDTVTADDEYYYDVVDLPEIAPVPGQT